jgi:chromosome partitioning protein
VIVSVASYKGGVGKTTTAIHLSCYLQQKAQTLLIDGDPNRSALEWARRGGLPFKVIDANQTVRYSRDPQFKHVVLDTEAHPEADALSTIADNCDLLVLPSTPDAMALHALMLTVNALRSANVEHFRVLLTVVPPLPNHDGADALEWLKREGVPVVSRGIRRFMAYQKAALAGVPVYDVRDARATDAWTDYTQAAKEIVK